MMRVFAQPGPGLVEFVAVGILMLRFSAFWQLFDAVGITLSEALRAAGDTTWTMAVRLLLAWIAFLPLAWLLVLRRGGGVATVMSLMVGYILALSATLGLRFFSRRWQNIDLIGSPDPIPRAP